MATLQSTIDRSGEDGGPLEIRRVAPEDHAQALAQLLTGQAAGAEQAVRDFLGFAVENKLSLDELWAAYKGGRLEATWLAVPCAGRSAMCFLSPIVHRNTIPTAGRLIRTACAALDRQRVRLVQALLDPHPTLQAEAFRAGGFQQLGCLVYLSRQTTAEERPLILGPGLKLVTWGEAGRPTFERAILASYEETQDCPGLLGLRDIDDIICGHMAAARFEPGLWFAVVDGDEPAAVMLLNSIPQRRAVELTYLGVGRRWRRRGIARALLQYGLSVAWRHGAQRMLLAVDQNNVPAMRLYRSLEFAGGSRKLAMIYPLV